MSTFPISPSVAPSGLFWFVAKEGNPSHLVPCIVTNETPGARPTIEAATWQLVQQVYPQLRHYAFDFFPRGAVQYCELRRLWSLKLDPKLARGAFIAHLVISWPLNPTRIAVLADRSYASRARIGPPVAGGSFTSP